MVSGELLNFDCGVVGAGLAGCSVALELADAGKKVAIFVKRTLNDDSSSTLLAGGLTAVPIGKYNNDKDSIELHIKDTLAAGKGLNDISVVEFCAKNFYPQVIQWLIDRGVLFDMNNGLFDLHKEGGHSKNRVFHVKDTTGRSIMDKLIELISIHPNIKIFQNHTCIDLITECKIKNGVPDPDNDNCLGFYVYDEVNDKVKTVKCDGTFICTGGLGKVFLYTSNPDISTGDGFAISYRAGLKLANMEFIQFHPTVFYDTSASKETERRFLLTEALRGSGAFLKLYKNSKEDFVLNHDPLGSKATRDVVSRAEDVEMRKLGLTNLWLDCTKIPKEKLIKEFKNSYDFCLSKGIDMSKDSVPVVYAEHYSNGGVLVDINSQTNLKSCYVIGETSYTGLHGATRLASNSGPECILFGTSAAKHFIKTKIKKNDYSIPLWKSTGSQKSKDLVTINYYWEVVRRTMNALCGMSRNEQRLNAALSILKSLKEEINKFYWSYNVTRDFLEVRNITQTAEVIVRSALERKETRACHCREDYPKTDNNYNHITIISKGEK